MRLNYLEVEHRRLINQFTALFRITMPAGIVKASMALRCLPCRSKFHTGSDIGLNSFSECESERVYREGTKETCLVQAKDQTTNHEHFGWPNYFGLPMDAKLDFASTVNCVLMEGCGWGKAFDLIHLAVWEENGHWNGYQLSLIDATPKLEHLPTPHIRL
jgi:hypothetical protein